MESHDHIVTRIPVARYRGAEQSRGEDIEVLNAWLWPSTDVVREQPAGDAATVEVCLLPKTRKLLREFPTPGLGKPYLKHLGQRILRNPRDLLSHVRRLYVASALKDRLTTEGALADLFIVLGSRGLPLRTRLLELVAGELSSEKREFFEVHLEPGLYANEAMPDLPQSRLSKRVVGTTQIVVRSKNNNLVSDGPVGLARESMASGHYEAAQAVLEGALESDPGDQDVSRELLELYKRNNLRSAFFRTYTTLLGRRLAHPEHWAAQAAEVRSAGKF